MDQNLDRQDNGGDRDMFWLAIGCIIGAFVAGLILGGYLF